MGNVTKQKLSSVTSVVCGVVGICSLVLFIPAIRNIIIDFGGRIAGHSLSKDFWNTKILAWEYSLFFVYFAVACFIKNPFSERLNRFIGKKYILLAICIFTSLSIIALACISRDIWIDETFSLGLTRHSVSELVQLTAQDVHPPLYYLILKLVLGFFPESITAAKIVSVIPIILMFTVGSFFLIKEYDTITATLFVLIAFATSSILLYAVEIRMYSWGCFFMLLCAIFSYYMVKRGELRYFILFAMSALLGAYTQYWIAVAEAILFALDCLLCLLKDKCNLKKLCLTAFLCVVGYSPWIAILFTQLKTVSGSYWIDPISIKNIAEYVFSLLPFIGFIKIAVLLLFAFAFIQNLIHFMKERNVETKGIKLVFAANPFLLILAGIILSIAIRPIFVSRYAVPTIPLLILFLSIEYEPLVKRKPIMLFCIAIFGIFTFSQVAKSEYENRVAYSNFQKVMKENISENTVFVTKFAKNSHISRCIAFLYPNNRHCTEFYELWTSVYNFNRENFISEYENEKDICFVLDEDDIQLPDKYKNYSSIKATFFKSYPKLRLVFVKE